MLQAPTLWRMTSTRARVVASYVVRQFKQHRSGPRLGFIFTVLEMIVGIVVLALLFSLIGRQARFGDSLVMFMLTGFAPFLTFMRISSQVGGAVEIGGNRNRSNLLTPAGYGLSQVVTSLVVTPIAVFVICLFLYAIGVKSAVPVRLDMIAASMFLMAMLAYGVGLFNAVFGHFFKPWRPIYEVMTRGLLFLSGVFYVPDYLPQGIGDILAWNPLMHVIALFRLGFYSSYPTNLLDVPYLFYWSIGALFVGLWAERLLRRQILA